jgi:magnesium-transporting ATPase (P-type)
MSSAEEDARQRRPLLTREGDESPAGHAAASVAVTVSDGHALKENLNRVQFFAPAEVYHALGTSPAGLSSAEAARRLDAFGPNVISNARRTHICIIFFSHFTHLMAILLWVAGAAARGGLCARISDS